MWKLLFVGLVICLPATAQEEGLRFEQKNSDKKKLKRPEPKIVFPEKFRCEGIIVHIPIKPRENRTYMITVRDRHKVFDLPIQIELKGKWLELPKTKSDRKVRIGLPILLQYVCRRESFERRCRREMIDPRTLTREQFQKVISEVPVKESKRDVIHTLDFVFHLPDKEIRLRGRSSKSSLSTFLGASRIAMRRVFIDSFVPKVKRSS